MGSDGHIEDVDDTSPYQAMLRASLGQPVHPAALHHLKPTGVMGSLQQMPLTEIIQTLDFGKKTARVEVYFLAMRGAVHVHDGQIVRADAVTVEADFHEGEAAVIELCRSKDGFFRIDYLRDTIDRNVQRPTTFVLLETLRILDEAANTGEPGGGGGDSDGSADGDDDGWGSIAARVDESARSAEGPADDLDIDLDGTGAHQIPVQQHPRYRIGVPVEVEDDDRSAELHCEDISLGGVFLRTASPPRLGTVVRLRVPAPGGGLALTGRVVHILDEESARRVAREPGMGVDFEGLSQEVLQQLRRFIDKMAAGPSRAGTGQSHDKIQSHVSESEFLVAAGDLKGAQRVLLEAHQLAPQDDDVRRRLRNVDEAIDAAQAHAFLEQAMRGGPQAVDFARRATQLRPVRDVLLRSLAVFAKAQAHDEVADVAEQLLEIDPDDEGALRTLLDANVAMKRWSVALRAIEALLKLHPEDEQLRNLSQKIVQMARRR